MKRPVPPKRYRKTERETKSGAYGDIEVWHDDMLDRDVVIKWLASPDGEEQLLNEWKMLSRATSPRVIEIYDLIFDRHGVLHGIVMEFVDGAELDSKFDGSGCSEERLRALYQLSLGLADLHSLPVIHRDVKPANVVVSGDGRVKIVDFGLSAGSSKVETVRVRGTFGYAAPEMFGPRPIVLTTAVDVFSLGVICWKILTGSRPSIGRSGMPTREDFPLRSIKGVSGVPDQLADIIDGTLQWDPAVRPSARAVADAFAAEIVKGQHRAFVELSSGLSVVDASAPKKGIRATHGTIQIAYDNYRFVVCGATGEVFVNGMPAAVGMELSAGCLLAFGDIERGMDRAYAPFRIATPEIVI